MSAYCLIPTTRIPTAFQLVAVNVGSGGMGIYSVTPDFGIDGMGSVDVRNAMVNVRNGYTCKFILGADS